MNLTQVKTEEEFILFVAEHIWKYFQHHKNQAVRYANLRHYLVTIEKIKVTNEVQNTAIKILIDKGLIHEVTHGVWRFTKQTKRSKKAEETFKVLSESLERKNNPEPMIDVVEPPKMIPKSITGDSHISMILELVNEHPEGISTSEARDFFRGIIKSGTVGPSLLDLAKRKLIKQIQEYRKVESTHPATKQVVMMERKVNVYFPLPEKVSIIIPPTTKPLVKPNEVKPVTKTHAIISFEFDLNSAKDIIATLNELGIHDINVKIK